MNADGFSVKTAIAQMGNVARTQLKGQQGPAAANQQVKRPGEERSRVSQVRKTEESQRNTLDPEGGKEQDHPSGRGESETEGETVDGGGVVDSAGNADTESDDTPGRVLDLKA